MEAFSTTMDARRQLRSILPGDIDAAKIEALVTEIRSGTGAATQEQAVADYLGLWENLAAGVNTGVLDLEMVDRIAGTRVMRLSENYEEWIAWRRRSWRSDSLFSEFDALAARIRRRRGL
jgi:Domain of unknown function (DUF4760)